MRYREIQCKTALNRVQGMPFKWSLNPYRGCVHACHYCYARATHSFYDLNADEDFETQIFVKKNVADALRRDLRSSWTGEQVALGTATDAYQPAEGRYRLTRSLLEVLLERHVPVGLVTKSPLVIRDADLLSALARVAQVRVWFTITTVDMRLWRKLEPGTANPFNRLRALRILREADVPAGVLMAPVLPCLTDSTSSIEAVAAHARAHGAAFFGATALRLMPLVKEHYLGFLEREFPHLVPRYLSAYTHTNAPRHYTEPLEARIDAVRERFGFGENSMRTRTLVPPAAPPFRLGQLALPL